MMDDNEKKLMGLRIKEGRNRVNLTQEELAEKLGKQRTNIANYESGRVVPPADVLKELAEILECESDYILGLNTHNGADDHAKRDLKDTLKTVVSFNGVEITNEERERILGFVESMFWDKKQK